MTPTQRWILIGLLAALLAGCSLRSVAPAEGPAAPVERPSDQREPAGAAPSSGKGGTASAGEGGEADREEANGDQVTMLDCLRRFGLAELGPAVDALIRGRPSDDLWQCVARTAQFGRQYRAWVAYAIVLSGMKDINTALPGYQAFARTTELRFGEPLTVPAPEGWLLRDAVPSPSGRHVAARLAEGGVGWWAVDGSAQERYDVAGHDLVWHPEEDQLLFLSGGNRVHLVRPAGPVVHQVFEAPVEAPIRFPYWALQEWHADEGRYPAGTVLVLADPEGEPEGLALRPDSGRWGRYPARRIPAPGREVIFPAWLTQPWSVQFGEYLHFDPAEGWLAQPDPGGSPYTLYQVPEGAEPVSLTWSPEARFFALVERREGRLSAQVLRGSHDYTGRQYSVPLQSPHIAVWDDGVTTFTAAGRWVRARDHLTGAERTWQVEGEVRGLHLAGSRLYIVLADRLIVVPFAEAASLSDAPGAEHEADAA